MYRLLRHSRLLSAKLSTTIIPCQSGKPFVIRLSQLTQLQQVIGQRHLHLGGYRLLESSDGKPATLVVYRGPLAGQMKRLKVFSLFTSAVGLYVAPTVMAEMGKAGMGVAVLMGSVMGLFTLLTPVLIHLVVRNYVTRLEYDPAADRYTASTITLMLRTRTVTFGVADVRVPDVPGMFTTFVAAGRPLFADGNYFEPVEHFGRIMGYDRPVDLKLGRRPPPEPPAGPDPPAGR